MTTRKDRHFSTEPSEHGPLQQFHATRRKFRCVHEGACVEATKIDLFGCSIQSQTYGNRSLESYSLISFFEVANHPLNCRGIFLPVYSSRAKKCCNCQLVSGLTHIFHFPSILGIESAKPGSFRPAMGIESAKMADIEMVDPLGCYFCFIQAHWSKQMQTEYVHPCCSQNFSFFLRIESEHCQAVRLAFVTWRRRLPGPPHQRWCPDLICDLKRHQRWALI